MNESAERASCADVLLEHTNRKRPQHRVVIVLHAPGARAVRLQHAGHVPGHIAADHHVVPATSDDLEPQLLEVWIATVDHHDRGAERGIRRNDERRIVA